MSSQIQLRTTEWLDPQAVALREAMNVESSALYGPLDAQLSPEQQALAGEALSTHADEFVATVMAFDGDTAVGHAALRPAPGEPQSTLEVKKVFVAVASRGRGISKLLMLELERIALERGVTRLVLQTGTLQHAAIALYEGLGYTRIPSYGKYVAIPFAVCFEKSIAEKSIAEKSIE